MFKTLSIVLEDGLYERGNDQKNRLGLTWKGVIRLASEAMEEKRE